MHNNVGNTLGGSNESVFSGFKAEKFGFQGNQLAEDSEEKQKRDFSITTETDVTESNVPAMKYAKVEQVTDAENIGYAAKTAIDRDGSFYSKELGAEFQKLTLATIEADKDDPSALNDDVNRLSEEAILGMFGRQIGRGK